MNKKFDMVICSTLNQLVNYIPIALLKDNIDDIHNITFNKKKNLYNQFDNTKWDENLSKVLKKIHINDISKIDCEDKTKVKDLYEKIEKLEDIEKNIIWNITGGQRNTVLAMFKVIQERVDKNNDKIIYFEGNKNDLKAIDVKNYINSIDRLQEINLFKNKDKDLKNKTEISKKELNLKLALYLTNFKENNIKTDKEPEIKEKEFFRKLNFAFEKELEDKKINLVDLLFKLNKYDEKEVENHKFEYLQEYLENKLQDNKVKKLKYSYFNNNKHVVSIEKYKNEQYEIRKFDNSKDIKALFDDIKKWDYYKEIIKKIIQKLNITDGVEQERIIDEMFECGGYTKNKFGYIFEKMILIKVLDTIDDLKKKVNNYFIDVKHSVKVYNNEEKEDECFTEFDIMLLTKYGKMIIIECKSGTMDHTVAKSRAFTTYAANGVYGLPILSIPAINISQNKTSKLNDEYIKEYSKYVYLAKRAAERSQMQIWGMEEFRDNLKKIAGED